MWICRSRIAADQHHPPGDQAAAQHAIEFRDTGRETRHLFSFDITERLHHAGLGGAGEAMHRSRLRAFGEGIPSTAMRTLPLPLGRLAATFVAGVDGPDFSHGAWQTHRENGPSNFHHRHSLTDRAEQLVAHRSSRFGNLVHRHRIAPKRDIATHPRGVEVR